MFWSGIQTSVGLVWYVGLHLGVNNGINTGSKDLTRLVWPEATWAENYLWAKWFFLALAEAVDEELDGELIESQVAAQEYSMLI